MFSFTSPCPLPCISMEMRTQFSNSTNATGSNPDICWIQEFSRTFCSTIQRPGSTCRSCSASSSSLEPKNLPTEWVLWNLTVILITNKSFLRFISPRKSSKHNRVENRRAYTVKGSPSPAHECRQRLRCRLYSHLSTAPSADGSPRFLEHGDLTPLQFPSLLHLHIALKTKRKRMKATGTAL